MGDSVYELKFQSGLRIYYAWEQRNKMLVVLGGKKARQFGDIVKAKVLWELFSQHLAKL